MNIPSSLRLSMVKNAVRKLMEELDPAIAGNEHLDKCALCESVHDANGLFRHSALCEIEIVKVFIKDPFMIVDDYTEAGKHYLGKTQDELMMESSACDNATDGRIDQ
jgi:hypothetical protein